MILDHVELSASPFFHRASCPKDGADMIILDNGWFSKCFYCPKCKMVFELKMMKMRNVKQENLKAALDAYYKQHPKAGEPDKQD